MPDPIDGHQPLFEILTNVVAATSGTGFEAAVCRWPGPHRRIAGHYSIRSQDHRVPEFEVVNIVCAMSLTYKGYRTFPEHSHLRKRAMPTMLENSTKTRKWLVRAIVGPKPRTSRNPVSHRSQGGSNQI